MKKKISAMLLALLMAFTLCTPAWASNGIMNYIIDAEDVLDYDEWDALEDRGCRDLSASQLRRLRLLHRGLHLLWRRQRL